MPHFQSCIGLVGGVETLNFSGKGFLEKEVLEVAHKNLMVVVPPSMQKLCNKYLICTSGCTNTGF